MAELQGKELAICAAEGALDKKAMDVQILDMGEVSTETNYFVVCSGASLTQLQAITQSVLDSMEQIGANLIRREGHHDNSWVLLDYGSIVVHIFLNEEREYYSLEKLWADAKKVPIN